MAAGKDGTVIVGCDSPECSKAIIQSSVDGPWRSADIGLDSNTFELHAVAFDGERFVAVGATYPADEGAPTNGVALVSDDGRTWRRAPDQSSLRGGNIVDVVARPGGGFEAVGWGRHSSPYTGMNVWSSGDGLSWRLVYSGADRGDVGVTGLAVSPDGRYVAWGSDCLGACGIVNVVMWTSDDGTTWRSVPGQATFKSASVIGTVALPGGWLATGTSGAGSGDGVSWRSGDGRSWTRQKLPKAGGYRMDGIVLVDGRVVALGIHEGDRNVLSRWETTDGSAWSGPSTVPGTEPDDVALTGGDSMTVAAMPLTTDLTTVLRFGPP